MKGLLTALLIAGIFTVALWMPAQAEMVTVGDNDLAGISGKSADGNTTNAGPLSQDAGSNSGNGNIQIGYFQWSDSHSLDSNFQKGSNYFPAGISAENDVQSNVVAAINEINWGAAANGVTNMGTITAGTVDAGGSFGSGVTGDVDLETWGTLYIGGF